MVSKKSVTLNLTLAVLRRMVLVFKIKGVPGLSMSCLVSMQQLGQESQSFILRGMKIIPPSLIWFYLNVKDLPKLLNLRVLNLNMQCHESFFLCV